MLLDRFRALTFDQLRVLHWNGDGAVCYKTLYALQKEGFITIRPHPTSGRFKYAALTHRGLEAVSCSDSEQQPKQPLKSDRALAVLQANELHVQLIAAGLPFSAFLTRDEVLTRFGLAPTETPVVGLANLESTRVAFYLRSPRGTKRLWKGIHTVTADKVDTHAIFYSSHREWKYDRDQFLERPPAGRVYLLPFNHDGVKALVDLLKEQDRWLSVLRDILAAAVPGGKIKRNRGSAPPFEWCWQRQKKVSLADLTYCNVGLAAQIKSLSLNHLKNNGWGDGLLVLVNNLHQAAEWARCFGYRKWIWYVTREGSPEQSLFRFESKAEIYYGSDALMGRTAVSSGR